MPLARLRCEACSAPLGDPPFSAIAIACGGCGRTSAVDVAADGAPPNVDAAFPPGLFLRWLAAARVAMASGRPGVSLGPCRACRAPLLLSSRAPLRLLCPHCAHAREGAAADLLVDQWPEPWARVEGAGVALEYRVAVVDDASGAAAGCPHCGAPTPPSDPRARCARCGSATWVPRGAARVQLGVRVDGERDGRPLHALVPVAQGEAMLRADLARVTSAESGSSLLGATGIGCAVAAGLSVLAVIGLALVAYFALKR
jgi:hypothetical protein